MLDNFDTGYEGKFDFAPCVAGPARTYLLASVPRAGSTNFSHLLWGTGCLGAPLEYLNFELGGPYGFASSSAELQLELWRSILRRRCSPNGTFGLKAFPQQLEMLRGANELLLKEVFATIFRRHQQPKIVYLRRKDRVAQTVSYARASLSGIWRKDQEGAQTNRLEYSQGALEAAERGIEVQETAWARMFEDLAVEPLTLWHEDVIESPDASTCSVAEYIGVPLIADAAVDVPQIGRQSPVGVRDWITRYARSRELQAVDQFKSV